jgi:hypothetical protein
MGNSRGYRASDFWQVGSIPAAAITASRVTISIIIVIFGMMMIVDANARPAIGRALLLVVWPEGGFQRGNQNHRADNNPGNQQGHIQSHLDEFTHRNGCVAHAIGEAPFIIIPGQDRAECAIHNFGLIHVENRGMRIMVEINRDVFLGGVTKDAFEAAISG